MFVVFLPEVSMRRFTSNVIIIDIMPVKIYTDSYNTNSDAPEYTIFKIQGYIRHILNYTEYNPQSNINQVRLNYSRIQ